MAINLGTRSISNLRSGPAKIYIADGNTISEPSSFGTNITLSNLNSLLASFTQLGTLDKNPRIRTSEEKTEVLDSNNVVTNIQLSHKVTAEIVVMEMDNTILNELLNRADNWTKTDFIWLREQAVGDYVNWIRDVPFSVTMDKSHSIDELEKCTIKIEATADQLKKIHGQYKII